MKSREEHIRSLERVYIRNLERAFGGNCVVWWRPNSHGYTTNLDEAGLYPVGFATEPDDVEVRQAVAERLAVRHVDVGALRAEPREEIR